MAQELTADERKVLRDLAEWVRAQFRGGRSRSEIVNQLEQSGYSTSFSADLITTVESNIVEQAAVAERDPMGDFVVAAIAIGIGGGITYLTFASANPGGTFLVFYGPALFGGWRLLQGIAKFIWSPSPEARRPGTVGMGLIAVVVAAASVAALVYAASNSQSADNTTTGGTSAPGDSTVHPAVEPPKF